MIRVIDSFDRKVQHFFDSANFNQRDIGVIVLQYCESNSDFYIHKSGIPYGKIRFTYLIDKPTFLKYFPPSSYAYHRNRMILIYTGFEFFAKPDSKSIDKLRKEIGNRLPDSQSAYGLPSQVINITKDHEVQVIEP